MDKNIRQYRIQDVVPGMIIGRDILSARGRVMVGENVVLTSSMIDRISCWGFSVIDIAEVDMGDPALRKKWALEHEEFLHHYAVTVRSVKNIFTNVRKLRKVPLQEVEDVARNLSATLLGNRGIINLLAVMQDYEDHTFQHSVNVAILSGMIGQWLLLSAQEQRELMLAALMHDIGTTMIALDVLNKPERLLRNEYDMVKRHAIMGYEMLKKAGVSSQAVLEGVRQHHERIDGSGYPRNLVERDISLYAKIIAVADVYDAMTSKRAYRERLSPFHVIETLSRELFGKVDPEICGIFSNKLQDYLMGCIVCLNDGRHAKVIYFDKERSCRPVVQTADGQYVDLEKVREFNIAQVLTV